MNATIANTVYLLWRKIAILQNSSFTVALLYGYLSCAKTRLYLTVNVIISDRIPIETDNRKRGRLLCMYLLLIVSVKEWTFPNRIEH